MFKAIFIDRDGVLVKDPGYVHKLEEFELYPDAITALQLISEHKLIIINSQPGIAKKIHNTEDSEKFNRHLCNVLASSGIALAGIYVCPHHPSVSKCDCRKPKPGLLVTAAENLDIDLQNSWMIGDKRSDIKAGVAASCRTILVKTGFGGEGGDTDLDAKPDFVVENLLEAATIIRNSEITAVIVAGGRGTRLAPLTDTVPKPMLDVCGKPILLWQVELLKKYGLRNFVFCTHYLHDVIENFFGDGSRFGVRINYCREQTPLGTGGAILNAAKFLSEDFILLAGDIITNFNVQELINLHKGKKAIATAVCRVSDHPEDSDLLELDFDNKILKFHEKKTSGEKFTKLGNTGHFMLNKNVLDFLLPGQSNLEKDCLTRVINRGQAFAYVLNKGYIKDVGTPERLEQVKQDFEKWRPEKV